MAEAVVGGVRIHYEVAGQGPAVVVTAGQGTGAQARRAWLEGLARSHRVLSYDQRGTGRSEPTRQGQSMQELAEDVLALMDHAGIGRAHVVGVSTGTGKATALAARHPDRVDRLVLAAPWTHADAQLQALQAMRKAAARTMPPEHYAHFNALLIYPPEHLRAHGRRFEALALQARSAPQDAPGIAARLDAILAFDARPLYPLLRCPTLVVGARDDLVMPAWHAQEAARQIPGAQLALLEHGGHLFAETRTQALLDLVLPFLAQDAVAQAGSTPPG